MRKLAKDTKVAIGCVVILIAMLIAFDMVGAAIADLIEARSRR